jgi:DNA-directed RNA polymerase subunit F
MPFSNSDLIAIKAELTNDPLTLGLTTSSADDEANANALNLVRVSIQVDRESVPVSEIVRAVDADEYIALSGPQRDYLQFITNGGSVDPKSGNEVREALLQFFSAQSETRTKLLALVTESSSRINQLYKAGTVTGGNFVTPSDVANARAAT